MRRKRSRRISTKHKHEYSDSSFESDSCDYSYDDAENGKTAKHRQHARKQQEKDKSKSSNETEAKSNSRKEDDDDRSVSDDSLEVIVVKRSLEKKCEKVVSGRRSKTPRECTKETKLTKTHKRSSSKKMSRSGKSRTFDKNENRVVRDESPDKEERSIAGEPAHISITEEEEGGSERIIESRYQRDATDSTSQETVERVVVTAMVHKDQMSDTPRSTQEIAKEISPDGVLKKKTTVIEETMETSKDITSSDKSKTALPHEIHTSEERLQQITQEGSRISEEVQNKDEIMMEDAKEGTNSKIRGKNLNAVTFL